MKFSVVDLGRDYSGHISDFAEARNSFIKDLPDNEYSLVCRQRRRDSEDAAGLLW
ncbi:MAG TPA: hypothetical protein VGS11_09285 [Candidatus Bathyarchaeia archaeon]|nr:hypothetical protein [Candidatus Bathyarchaeia archaeon]